MNDWNICRRCGETRNDCRVGQIYIEDCGCRWKIIKINKHSYTVQHLLDGDGFDWSKKQFDEFVESGALKRSHDPVSRA